ACVRCCPPRSRAPLDATGGPSGPPCKSHGSRLGSRCGSLRTHLSSLERERRSIRSRRGTCYCPSRLCSAHCRRGSHRRSCTRRGSENDSSVSASKRCGIAIGLLSGNGAAHTEDPVRLPTPITVAPDKLPMPPPCACGC